MIVQLVPGWADDVTPKHWCFLPPLWHQYTNTAMRTCVDVCVKRPFNAALYEVQPDQPGRVNLLPRASMNSTREPPLSQNKLLTESERTCC